MKIHCALLVLLAPPLLATQTERLNPPFRGQVAGQVEGLKVHPSNAAVLFRVDARHAGIADLYRAPIDGSGRAAPVAVAGYHSIADQALSPDGNWVAFLTDAETPGVSDLYSHRVNAPGWRRLSADGMVGSVLEHRFAGDWIVYTRNSLPGGRSALLVVPADGSRAPLRLDDPALGHAFIAGFEPDPAGQRVVYRSVDASDQTFLYSVALSDGARVQLGVRPLGAAPVCITPNGAQVVFTERASPVPASELLIAPLDGSTTPRQLDVPPDSILLDLEVSPDGTRAVYSARNVNGGLVKLHSVALDGSGPRVEIGADLSSTVSFVDFGITAESSRVIFHSNGSSSFRLFSAPLGGGPTTLLAEHPLDLNSIALTPDGSRAVYLVVNRTNQLYSVPTDGSTPAARLDDEASGLGAPSPSPTRPPFLISADSRRVLYPWGRVFQPSFAGQGLCLARIEGGGGSIVVPPRSSTGLIHEYSFDRSQGRALFTSESSAGGRGLFSVSFATPSSPLHLDVPLARGSGQDVVHVPASVPGRFFAHSETGEVLFLVSSPDLPGNFELWRSREDGALPPSWIADLPSADARVSPDGRFLVYTTDLELWLLALDGSSAPVRIAESAVVIGFAGARLVFTAANRLWTMDPADATPLELASAPSFVSITPDGSRVLFVVPSGSRQDLRSRPADGSAPSLRIALGATGDTLLPRSVSPDGARVLFTTHRLGSGLNLWRGSIDGSNAPALLHASMQEETRLVFHAESQSIFFVAWEGAGKVLLRAPLDGSSPPLPLASIGEGAPLVATSAGMLLYVSDAELHSVPVNGGAATQLTGNGVGFQFRADHPELVLTPDQGRALFVGFDPQLAIFAVPVDGSAAPTRVSTDLDGEGSLLYFPPLPGVEGFPTFTMTPDGSELLYRVARDGETQLVQASLLGRHRPLRISAPLAFSGSQLQPRPLDLSRDGKRVLLFATKEPGTVEFFSTPLARGPKDRHTRR